MMALLRFLSLCILILTLLLLRLCFSSFAGSRFVLALPPPPPSPLPALVGGNCPSRCATLSNISFPFSIMSPNISSSCGLPDFRLNCSHSTPDISWWPENFPLPLASILKITANHITSGTFVVGPPPAFSGPPIDACSPRQVNSLISSPPSDFKIPLGLQFSPHGNIILLTNCSDNLTSRINVNETIDGFSFSSPNCLRYDSVCSNVIRGSVPCLEAISADANVSLAQQRYGCLYNIALYELPKYANATLSLQISWAISQSYYDCKACEGSNGSCTVNNFNDSFRCSCPNDRHASSPGNICGSAETPQFCKGICKNNVHILIGVAAIAVAILIVGAGFGVYCCRHRARLMRGGWQIPISAQRQSEDRLKQILAREDGAFPACTRKFSYMELCAATDGFAESKVLGDGGFGTVYEGTLKCNGEKVAVKRLYSENARRLEQFLNEIRILSTLNHPNLVRLHGFCCESFTELLLVYEFASNGTLADNLHGMTGKGELPWETRLCIALETAGALAYMHERDPPILHRDVKSSNILLDDRFHAKLADFGLSRRVYAKTNALHVSTAPQGTPGYVDPQYQQCYQLTDKSDVYSFGVVLMELISGMAPVDMSRRHNDHINLSSLAVSKIQTGALHELIDPFLLQECSGVPHMHDMVAGVAELAFLCLAPLQDDRPSMPQVTLALLDIARSSSSTGVTSNVSTPISLDSA